MVIRSVISVTVFAAAVTGCTQAAPPPPVAPPPPAATGPGTADVAWSDRICDLVSSFLAAQQHGPPVDRSSTQALKASTIAQISASEKAADDTVKGLQAMSPSPIPSAEPIPATLANGFRQVHDVLDAARTKAERIDATNNQTLAAGMAGVQQELQRGQSINLNAGLVEFDRDPRLSAAAAQAPTCKTLMQQQQQQQPPPSQ